jgi:hypothetical protein
MTGQTNKNNNKLNRYKKERTNIIGNRQQNPTKTKDKNPSVLSIILVHGQDMEKNYKTCQ